MFEGFTPETVDFLWGIRLNNNREWFLEHKKEYTDNLYKPMKELGWELLEPYVEEEGQLLKVSRIYRDSRMHYPVPYKDHLWISLRRNGDDWSACPNLFFEITPDGFSYGLILWRPKPAAMERMRRAIAAKPKEFLALVEKTERETGLPLTAGAYKKHKPCEDERLIPFYFWKDNIQCIHHEAVSENLFGKELKDRVALLWQQLTPIYRFLDSICLEP